jgi:hypothetical protein
LQQRQIKVLVFLQVKKQSAAPKGQFFLAQLLGFVLGLFLFILETVQPYGRILL